MGDLAEKGASGGGVQGDSVARRTGESGASDLSCSGERGCLRVIGDLLPQSGFIRHLENGVEGPVAALKSSPGEVGDRAMVLILRAPNGVPQWATLLFKGVSYSPSHFHLIVLNVVRSILRSTSSLPAAVSIDKVSDGIGEIGGVLLFLRSCPKAILINGSRYADPHSSMATIQP